MEPRDAVGCALRGKAAWCASHVGPAFAFSFFNASFCDETCQRWSGKWIETLTERLHWSGLGPGLAWSDLGHSKLSCLAGQARLDELSHWTGLAGDWAGQTGLGWAAATGRNCWAN